jgi:protein gp37
MAGKSNIEWTGFTWNPIAGCSVKSPGCKHCYAMPMAARLEAMGQELYKGLTDKSKAGPVFNGTVRQAGEHVLLSPLRRKKPTTFFVNSMSDLFHENVSDEWIDKVFAVMALAPQHTFQCLTKRAARMRKYSSDPDVTHRVAKAIDAVHVDRDHDPVERWAPVVGWSDYEASTHGNVRRDHTILKQVPNPITSRPTVTLWQANEPKTFFVHTLVLLAHKGPAPEDTEARHRNGNSQDNRLANLEWASGSINQADKVRHGSNGGPAKLNREQAAQIRSLRAAGQTQQSIADQFGVSRSLISMIESRSVWPDALAWPLPNCWLGVSTERQQEADERIPLLLQTPAAVRFISAEPLLGPIDLTDLHVGFATTWNALGGRGSKGGLDWVIVGGESGRQARAMHPDWARSLRDQCSAAGVRFFFKQWGEWAPSSPEAARGNPRSGWQCLAGHPHVANASELYPQAGAAFMEHKGKKAAGRHLDGVLHDAMPQADGRGRP